MIFEKHGIEVDARKLGIDAKISIIMLYLYLTGWVKRIV
jgi:hypothetical protein